MKEKVGEVLVEGVCVSTVQVHTHTSNNMELLLVGVSTRVRNGPPPSLGFPRTLRLHFLLLNSFFPTAPQRKWSITASGPSCLFMKGQLSLYHIILMFYLFVCLIRGALQMLQ